VSVRDPNPRHRGRGIRILKGAGIRVVQGVCHEEGAGLIGPFSKWITGGLPYVTLKLGMSIDGKIADSIGRSKWITSGPARRLAQQLRNRVDAVMVGSGTACADNPSLLPAGARNRKCCLRVIVDSRGSLPASAKVFNDGHARQTIVATTSRCAPGKASAYAAKGATVWRLPLSAGHVSLPSLMRRLAGHGVLHVLCEGGGILAAELVQQKLVDEIVFLVAPRILGGTRSVSAFGGHGWSLDASPFIRILESRFVGKELLIRAEPVRRRRK